MAKRHIVFVTSNPHKVIEVNAALQRYGITISHRNVDIPEIQSDTLENVIRDKVEKAFQVVRGPVIVDDAGIFFKNYNHFPGVYSRFIFMALGFPGILKLIPKEMPAYFASYIAYKDSVKSAPLLFSGRCNGKVINQVRGKCKPKMPYDNVFIPQGDTQTFAEMSIAGKQRYDHRSKAVAKLVRHLTQYPR